MKRIKVLFVCIHNSARSQMAEGLLKDIGGERFDVESAGIEPGKLNPMVVEAMKEDGIDISGYKTKSVNDVISRGRIFDYVITVCDAASAQRCPVVPGGGQRIHVGFRDPSTLKGSYEERLSGTRKIRDEIRAFLLNWKNELD